MTEPREVKPTPAELRPLDERPVHTADLPDTPTRDRSIPASAWIEAPAALTSLDDARYLRRIGPWLLWRSGPARGDHACYWVCRADDPDEAAHHFTFELFPDGTGSGRGPTASHTRFRTWKEDLRDHG
ncbi:MAG: hypothetical protein JWO77_588 [Ilumatobacteraceae bacterium]|nr:hypothetical protein [Ilumatobacteraceae bacterium]